MRMLGPRSSLLSCPLVRAVFAAGAILVSLAFAASALGAPTSAHWALEARPSPTNLPLQGEGMLIVSASDIGDAAAGGEAEAERVTLTDKLPPGLEVTKVTYARSGTELSKKLEHVGFTCTEAPVNPVSCTFSGTLQPFEQIEMRIYVKTDFAEAAAPENQALLSVGGIGQVELAPALRHLEVNGKPTSFGVEAYELQPENERFEPDLEAGSHPFQLTTTFNLNEAAPILEPPPSTTPGPWPSAPALQKNLTFKLPAGLVGDANVLGNPNAVQQCNDVSFGTQDPDDVNSCPENTAIGVAVVTYYDPIGLGFQVNTVPVFNLIPGPGEPARFGFEAAHVPIILNTSVRTGEDYGANVSVYDASQSVQILGSKVTVWGTPGDSRHDNARGWQCLGEGTWIVSEPHPPCEHLELANPTAFLMLPTQCEQLNTTAEGEAWNAGELASKGEASTFKTEYTTPQALTGCAGLPFEPTMTIKPETEAASTPTGMEVQVKMPQQTTLEENGKEEADIKSTTLELPEGLQASAGAANGLGTCGVGEAGFLGSDADTAATLEGELEAQRFTPAEASCQESSKIGTVAIKTPLLEKELKGSVYLGDQDTNPFASPLVLYIVAEEEESKVLVKLAGEVEVKPTGQLVSRFKKTPQSPFETLTLHLTGGERASEATPAHCGPQTSTATFTSWASANDAESQTAESKPTFQITSGPGGTPCPGETLPFSPSVKTGSANTQAGAFSSFSLIIGHPDGNQAIEAIDTELPPGIAAIIANVTPCSEAQADQFAEGNETCTASSEVGETISESGLGGDPVTLKGKLFFTGPLKATSTHGASPFGLLAVTEAKAGPFNLGDVDVLSTININEYTAQAIVKSEPIPKIIKGVPVQLKAIDVNVNRPNFEFNPTDCEELKLTGALTGYEGASSPISYPFFVSNCAALPFAPKLIASVAGQGSKPNGVTFTVKVESPGLGQANIHKVDLTLPEVLPSRQSTIEKACVEAAFNASPTDCDEGSIIGEGIVHTPVFRNPLRGKAYLVSHGAAAFPDVEFVLKGEGEEAGVTVVLDGKTDIKKGITYSKFETAPDAPFTSFESIFPAGPHSALTTYVPEKEDFSLCNSASKLTMPTTIVAQDGVTIEETTKIGLEGCKAVLSSKTKKLTRAQRLAKALKACKRKYKKKSKRVACERQARKKYGPVHKKKGAKKSANKSSRTPAKK